MTWVNGLYYSYNFLEFYTKNFPPKMKILLTNLTELKRCKTQGSMGTLGTVCEDLMPPE